MTVRLVGSVNARPASHHLPQNGGEGTRPSLNSTVPYVNPRDGRCQANDNTCKAYAMKGNDGTRLKYCVGHSRGAGDE